MMTLKDDGKDASSHRESNLGPLTSEASQLMLTTTLTLLLNHGF